VSARHEPPKFEKTDFHCPYCGIHARQYWQYAFYAPDFATRPEHLETLRVAYCNACKEYSVWRKGKIIDPLSSTAPMPPDDMPDDMRQDYLEARDIVGRSPRAAAALLRLSLQKLMPHLDERGKDLNDDIASLVRKGLPEKIQKGLDSLRVIGNNAVHPGQIDLKDDPATATALFELLNMIVDVMIAQPKRVDEIYAKVPVSAKEAIEKRDRPGGGAA